ncbi:class I SAM-dependent methyltransferase [Actinopolymorpha pittospori]
MATQSGGRGFDGVADAYRRSRPAYPDAAVDALVSGLGLASGGHVVDLGAGTGVFSRLLANHGFEVTGVEPSAAMRAHIAGPGRVTPHAGEAEATGLRSGCADAVVAATAWHWFDAARAIQEVRRLLRPGVGGLGLLWNLYDESVVWVAEFADITYRRRPAGSPSARDGAWRGFFDGLTGWSPLREARFPNPQTTTPERLVDRLMSSSAVANLPAEEQGDVRDEAWALLRRHGLAERSQVVLPYVTAVYWTRPSPDRRDLGVG